jgi:dihydroorotate dehydrogenase electron transfer subunit
MKLKPEALKVIENVRTAPGHYRMRLASPRIARTAKPGQFVQITVGEDLDPLLPRPFSFLQTGPGWFDLLYQVVGRGTRILAGKKKGDALTVLGPLGRGWELPGAVRGQVTHVLAGGGVGIPPLYHWAETLVKKHKVPASRIRVFLGGRSKDFLHCEKAFAKLGVKPVCATDDGSKGFKGRITGVLEPFLSSRAASVPTAPVQIYTCGPTPMLKAVSALAAKYSVPAQVSVEEPMPCGFGVCLGCAIKVSDDKGGHRFALSCTEGPVFDACKVMWS